jgi:pantoate kinase
MVIVVSYSCQLWWLTDSIEKLHNNNFSVFGSLIIPLGCGYGQTASSQQAYSKREYGEGRQVRFVQLHGL